MMKANIFKVMALVFIATSAVSCYIFNDKDKKEIVTNEGKKVTLNKDTCTTSQANPPGCTRQIVLMSTHSLQANWLRLNGDSICECELFDYSKSKHNIDSTKFKDILKKNPHRVNDNVLDKKNYYGSVTWEEIKRYTEINSRYGAYFGFDVKEITDATNYITYTIKIKFIKQYTDTASCYSIPLFKSIGKNMDDNDTFDFTLGKDINQIIFKVNPKKSGTEFYDISDDPGKLF